MDLQEKVERMIQSNFCYVDFENETLDTRKRLAYVANKIIASCEARIRAETAREIREVLKKSNIINKYLFCLNDNYPPCENCNREFKNDCGWIQWQQFWQKYEEAQDETT